MMASMNSDETKATYRNLKIWLILTSIGLVVLVVLVGLLLWLPPKKSKQPAADTRTQSHRVIDEVGALYLLPTNEAPTTVAKILDKTKLDHSQPFYQNAKNGDFLLIYSKNKLALLYRESVNKLVNVGTVSIATDPQSGP